MEILGAMESTYMNFALSNTLSTIAYGVIILCLLMAFTSCKRKKEKERCKMGMASIVLAIGAFVLLIIGQWTAFSGKGHAKMHKEKRMKKNDN